MIMLQTPAEGEWLHLRIRKQIISLTFGVVSADSFGLVEGSPYKNSEVYRSYTVNSFLCIFFECRDYSKQHKQTVAMSQNVDTLNLTYLTCHQCKVSEKIGFLW